MKVAFNKTKGNCPYCKSTNIFLLINGEMNKKYCSKCNKVYLNNSTIKNCSCGNILKESVINFGPIYYCTDCSKKFGMDLGDEDKQLTEREIKDLNIIFK